MTAQDGATLVRREAGGAGGTLYRVSTRGLDESERFAHWEAHNAKVLFGFSARSLDASPFAAAETTLKLSSLTFAHVTAQSHVIERNQLHIGRGEAEGAMLFFSLEGDTVFHHNGGNLVQHPGTLLVCDANRPFLRGFARGLREYAVTVPRDVFTVATAGPVPREPVVVPFTPPSAASAPVSAAAAHAAALVSLLRERLVPESVSPSAAADAEHGFLELMSAMLAPGGEGSPTARTQTALAFIRSRLRDPALSVSTVARGIGVSERSLTRAFAETGQGVARTILELRLSAAHRLLSRPGALSVREVARSCGFVSATHFSRVFRERYGQTPSEARAHSSSPE